MADQWMRFGSAVQFLQALGPQTERMREEVEKEERVCCLWLYLTLVTLSWFLNISQNLLLSSSLIGRIHHFFSSISRYFLNLLLGMSDTQFQQKTKTDLVILHEWLTHVWVPLSFSLSLSLMYVFSISRYLYLSISPLSFFISLCVSPSHSSVMVGRWGLLGELGVLRRSGRTLTLEMDHTSLSSAKPEAKFKQLRVYSSTW